ncbi:uncharacterized protein LOC113152645 [Anabas testudineus]|uniref:uncharacterized protein LOC113152645 n=1 Tax=Anabas testudineus TaxID=64144 RepID=UPI000E45A02A|nr:uncharacterized protein LOC113152645 [Anabas testudineus]
MMMLIFSLAVTWALFSTASALQCQTCTNSSDPACLSTTLVTCPSNSECLTANIQGQQILKACAPSAVCPAPGRQSFSFSTSGTSVAINAQCCNTDNCNTDIVGSPTLQSVNNLRCYSCDVTNPNCSIQIQCKGVEDRCFRQTLVVGSVSTLTLGCASANLCGAVSNLTSMAVFTNVSTFSCCGNNLCNSAPTTTTMSASILLGLFLFLLY